jgi:hypothetical protein
MNLADGVSSGSSGSSGSGYAVSCPRMKFPEPWFSNS